MNCATLCSIKGFQSATVNLLFYVPCFQIHVDQLSVYIQYVKYVVHFS